MQKAYESAKSGIRNKGIYADAVRKRQRNLEKSIASHVAQVEEHARKIQNPENTILDGVKKMSGKGKG